jgi:HIV Tat-specific factor 1
MFFFTLQAIASNSVLATHSAQATQSAPRVAKRKLKGNSTVYVRGLPLDITEAELCDWAKKAGVIKLDPDSKLPKVKLYRNEDGSIKGDASISFLFLESVQQALVLLDGDQIRFNFPVTVEEAKYESNKGSNRHQNSHADANDGDDDSDAEGEVAATGHNKPKRKAQQQHGNHNSKLTVHEQQQRALDWDEDLYKKRHVILTNLFDPRQVEPADLDFYPDLKADVRRECEKLGRVESIHVFEGSPAGVIAVKFADWLGADRCVRTMTGRRFDERTIVAQYYDNKTDYAVGESADARAARDAAFAKWLDGADEANNAKKQQKERKEEDDDDDDDDDNDD